jgi:hypothetical protein
MGDTAMALYYFDLNANDLMVRDVEGTECANDSEAREHARVVAGELMQNRASACLTWMLAVSDSAHAPLFKLPFSELDDLDAHEPAARTTGWNA